MKQTNTSEIVILLHGIAHNKVFMLAAELALKNIGYKTLNISYPSQKKPIKDLAAWLKGYLDKKDVWSKYDKVHFVAHSMGGLVSGFYLDLYESDIPAEKMGRVVMLGTPHGGSQVANALKDNPLYRWFFGPAGQELTTNAREIEKIKPWYQLGIIAGSPDNTFALGQFWMGNENHDGCVSIQSTVVDGMVDHRTVPVMHNLMAWTPDVQKHMIFFLRTGKFGK